MRRRLLALAALAALVLLAGPASAAPDQVLAGLRVDPLYVAPDSVLRPDEATLRAALRRTPVPTYVAIVPQAEVDTGELGIDGLMLALVDGLADPRAVVVVVSDGGELQAGEGGQSGVDAAGVLDRVLAERLDEPLTGQTLTAALVELAGRVAQQAEPAHTDRRTLGLVGLVGTVALGAGLLYARTQRQVRAQAPLTDNEPGPAGWTTMQT